MTISADAFLDRTVVLYGPTMTGKSFLINAILAELSKKVRQAAVFCTTDPQTGAYSASGILPAQLVHSSLTQEMLEAICERQEALMGATTKANRAENIDSLFCKLPFGRWHSIIDGINLMLTKKNAGCDDDTAKANTTIAQENLHKAKKAAIFENKTLLTSLQLSSDEQYTLQWLFVNPRIVLVFDDCTPELNTLKKTEVIKKIFFQGRWAGITALIAAHTDKALDPEIKKGVFVSIFTHHLSVNEFFQRDSNNIDVTTKKKAVSATSVFEEEKHQKLVYFREGGLCKVIAKKPEPFTLCDDYIWAVCKQVAAQTTSGVPRNNRFYNMFHAPCRL